MADQPLSKDEELEVVFQMMEGDTLGLVRLMQAYGPRVKWLLMKKFAGVLNEQDVDGAINLAAHNAWRAASDFDDRKARLGAWFYTIAHNAAVDLLRGSDANRAATSLEFEPDLAPREPACIADDENDPVIEDLLRCIEELGTIQKTIIKADIAAGGDADAARLAKKLAIPKQHVYSYRNKARDALLKRMEKRGHTVNTIRRKR